MCKESSLEQKVALLFLTSIYAETKEETGNQLQQQEVVDCDQQGKHCETTILVEHI